MIDVKTAVDAARKFVVEVYGSEEVTRLLLEEVELSDSQEIWWVTLSIILSDPMDLLRDQRMNNRAIKMFKVDAETGAVLGMMTPSP